MEKSSTRAVATAPLARDPDGNLIALPEAAAGWRIRRQTGGRPRLLLDASKQPMLFPLHYTVADAEDILAPGNYRLDVVDKNGEALDITVPLSVGAQRNAGPGEPDEISDDDKNAPVVVPTNLPAGSDTRLVLEANVRATQMAFLHNQRTLELGLRMAETLRDGVHVLVDAQADWIKSVSSARGFFRNAAPPPPVLLPAPSQSEEEEEDDDEGNDGAEQRPATLMDYVAPHIGDIAKEVVRGIFARLGTPSAPVNDETKLDLRDVLDWRHAAEKGKTGKKKAAAATTNAPPPEPPPGEPPGPPPGGPAAKPEPPTAEPGPSVAAAPEANAGRRNGRAGKPAGVDTPPLDVMALFASLPPELIAKLMQVRSLLTPDEQQRMMAIVAHIPRDRLMMAMPELLAMSAEQLAEFLRTEILTLEEA